MSLALSLESVCCKWHFASRHWNSLSLILSVISFPYIVTIEIAFRTLTCVDIKSEYMDLQGIISNKETEPI